jgi:ElaB/YqjD/DUF883 family membrane-anchored ribosome-binding protein
MATDRLVTNQSNAEEPIMSTNPESMASPSRVGSTGRTQSFSEQSRKVADDVRELGSIAVAGAGEALQSLKERGADAVEGVREHAQKSLEQGKKQIGKARDGFEDYVAENPFKSIMIAVGIGTLLGYSLRSRNS